MMRRGSAYFSLRLWTVARLLRSIQASAIDTTGFRAFLNDHLTQLRQSNLQTIPYPHGNILRCGILQSFNVVQIFMIEFIQHGMKSTINIGKIHHPTAAGINRPPDVNFHAKGMTVHFGTFMPCPGIREPMSRIKFINFENLHVFFPY